MSSHIKFHINRTFSSDHFPVCLGRYWSHTSFVIIYKADAKTSASPSKNTAEKEKKKDNCKAFCVTLKRKKNDIKMKG